MRDNRRIMALVGAVVALVVVVGVALGCTSDARRVRALATSLMESYVPVGEDADEAQRQAWASADFGDPLTSQALAAAGVDVDAWHRACMANLSFEVGDVSVEKDHATASVTITNQSLSAALVAAAAQFQPVLDGEEGQQLLAEGGRQALVDRLAQCALDSLSANAQPVTTTVEVGFAKDGNGDWTPQVSGDAAFFSALYGGTDVVNGFGVAAQQ